MPANEVAEMAVGVVLGVDVELPLLDLVLAADAEAFVEFGELRGDVM